MRTFLQFAFVVFFIAFQVQPLKAQEKTKKQEIQIRVDGEQQGTSYRVKVVTEEDGKSSVVEKTYGSLEEMESDTTLSIQVSDAKDETFNIKIGAMPEEFEWIQSTDSAGHKVIKTEGGNFVISDVGDPGQHILTYLSEADSNRMVHAYEIKLMKQDKSEEDHQGMEKEIIIMKDGEGNFSIRKDGSVNKMEWMGRENNTPDKVIIKKSVIEKASITDVSASDDDFSDFNISSMPALNLKNINYYPNPNEGEFTLAFTGSKKPVIVRILDRKGNLMYEVEEKDFTGNFNRVINVKHFNKGDYLIQIHQQGKVLNKRLRLE